MMFVRKLLTSKVFIQKSKDGGYWNVLLGNKVRETMPFGKYGLVLESYIHVYDAKVAAAHYQEILSWRNGQLAAIFANARIRAKRARDFHRQDTEEKCATTKVLIVKKRNTSLIGPTYILQVANDFVSPRKWITLNTEFITSSREAIDEARAYTKLLKQRDETLQRIQMERQMSKTAEELVTDVPYIW